MLKRITVVGLVVALGVGVVVGLRLLPRASGEQPTRNAEPTVSARSLTELPTSIYGQQVVSVAIGPGSQVALATGTGDVFLYGLPGSRYPGLGRGAFVAPGDIRELTFSGNGHKIAGATATGTIWEWNPVSDAIWTGQVSAEVSDTPFTESAGLALNENGSLLAINTVGTPEIYRQRNGVLELVPVSYQSHQDHIEFLPPVFSANSSTLTESGGTGLESWNVRSGAERNTDQSCSCANATISADLSTAAVDQGNFVQVWNLSTGRTVGDWRSKEIGPITLSRDGHVLAWVTGKSSIEVTYVSGAIHGLAAINPGASRRGSVRFHTPPRRLGRKVSRPGGNR